jgi:carboxylesterase type B
MFRVNLLAVTSVVLSHATVVQLPNGLELRGKQTQSRDHRIPDGADLIDQYLGIPFAEPPVGPLRFRPPNPSKVTWDGVKKFDKTAKPCFNGKDGSLEDCLYLNVYRPSIIGEDERLPVMMWIFGGGFVNGRVELYDGSELAARNRVIVVVPAYRLGMLGFFASEASLKESGTTGNWGLLDQRMAMQWIHDNIAAFKGDPNHVTLFGQSAGAFSIAAHLVSKGSRGLFHGAILSSPTSHSSFFFQNKTESTEFSDWAATTLAGCRDGNDMECLRSVPISRLAVKTKHRDSDGPHLASRLFPYMPWGLTIDGVTLTGTPLELARLGHVADVPVILGITKDEGSVFAISLSTMIRPQIKTDIPRPVVRNMTNHLLGLPELTETLLKDVDLEPLMDEPVEAIPEPTSAPEIAIQRFQEFAAIKDRDFSEMTYDEFLTAVPSIALFREMRREVKFDRVPFHFFIKTLKDSLFSCPAIDFAEAISAHNGGRVWMYSFGVDVWADTPWVNARVSDSGTKAGNLTFADIGTFHGAELPFIWNLFPDKNTFPGDLNNPMNLFTGFSGKNFCPRNSFKRLVADQIGCLWTNLAKCGSPQCEDSDCGIDTQWTPVTSEIEHIDIHDRGAFTLKSESHVRSAFPSRDQCKAWKDLRIPFLNFAALEKAAPSPVSSYYADASFSRQIGGTIMTAAVLIFVAMLV